jgi:hypothetical protein
MRKSKTVKLTGGDIAVYELTAAQVRDVMDGLEADKPPSIVDMLFPGDLPAAALAMACNKFEVDIEALAPSEIDALMAAAIEMNPFFFAMLKKLARVGRKITEAIPSPGGAAI